MKREQLEQEMADMLDSGFSREEEQKLLLRLKAFPDLKDDWELLRTGLPVRDELEQAFPLEPASDDKLSVIHNALQDHRNDRVWSRLTGTLAAAALLVIAFTGLYMDRPAGHSYTPDQIAEWVYSSDQQQAFYEEQYLLVDQFVFTGPESLSDHEE